MLGAATTAVEVGVSVAVITLCFPIFMIVLPKFARAERKWIIGAFICHIMATVALVWVHTDYYGYGDMLSYHRVGAQLADMMRGGFSFYAPDVWRIFWQQEPDSIRWIHGIGNSTGTMYALAGFLNLIALNSLYGICLIVGILSYFGLLAMYAALRTGIPEELHIRLLLACLYVPSVAFWSGGIMKEAVAIAGLGFATLALYDVVHSKKIFRGVLIGIPAVLMMGLTKGYLLIPFTLASCAWMAVYFARRANRDIAALAKPGYALIGLVVGIVGMIAIGEIFPRYSIVNLTEEAAHLQEVGARTEGGSNYAIVSDPVEMTFAQQLLHAPLAIITSLFRPFIFEVHNPFSLLSALEAMAAMSLLFVGLYRRGVAEYWRRIISSPTLIYSVILVLMLALGVGLTTTNMGSLSRYRIPMMPLYFALLLLLVPLRKSRFSRGQKRFPRKV